MLYTILPFVTKLLIICGGIWVGLHLLSIGKTKGIIINTENGASHNCVADKKVYADRYECDKDEFEIMCPYKDDNSRRCLITWIDRSNFTSSGIVSMNLRNRKEILVFFNLNLFIDCICFWMHLVIIFYKWNRSNGFSINICIMVLDIQKTAYILL